jgi:hypothetical protein
MKGLAILAGFLAAFLLAGSALAAGHPPRPGRHGPVLVGYIYSGGKWQLHVDLAQPHQFPGPGFGTPTNPPRTIQAVTFGGVYGPVGFCRHGLVYLTEQPPTLPGGVFPFPQPPIFPRPLPRPFPPLPPTPIFTNIFTNPPPVVIPVRPIQPAPPPTPMQPISTGSSGVQASRMSRAADDQLRPPLPPSLLQREVRTLRR